MIDLGVVVASPGDLLRVLVVPVFGWAAWRDVRTRRVPNLTWVPLAVLGVALLAWDAWQALAVGGPTWELFAIRAGISLGMLVPLAYLFWRMGGFGGADAKALMVLALLFPTYPAYLLGPGLVGLGLPGALPAVDTGVAVFSFTVLTNAVLVGLVYPVVLSARNALSGRFSRSMAVGRPVSVESVPRRYGRLLEGPGGDRRRGLDLDALRMYLRWRGVSLADLRADPDRYRGLATLPDERNDPGDGTVESAREAEVVTDGGTDGTAADSPDDGDDSPDEGARAPDAPEEPSQPDEAHATEDAEDGTDARHGGDDARDDGIDTRSDEDDPWGAEAFLEDAPHGAYGTTPRKLRDGLEVLVGERDEVWVSPGLPFMVPLFLGLVVGLTYGDLLFATMLAVGLV